MTFGQVLSVFGEENSNIQDWWSENDQGISITQIGCDNWTRLYERRSTYLVQLISAGEVEFGLAVGDTEKAEVTEKLSLI